MNKMPPFAELPVASFLNALSNSEPTPGGGAAAAVAGAMGASLLMMVAGLAKSRTNADTEQTALAGARTAAETLRATLLALADTDAAAFDTVMAAFRLPKATDDEKAARSAAIQLGYRTATEAPLDTLRAAAEALTHAEIVAAHGNRSAVSDIGVAVGLLVAAADGAAANVRINLGSLKDAALVERFTGEVARLTDAAAASAAAARACLE